ncbi:helix-turn-helix domain-containing protein [Psychrobacillus sp. FSL K6-1464]|uniref:helix-turn-helix domain-containing protein n=1 Tax=Psychrobacillus sp. FSL K6-1464 TaxID=2921545 RepID=UPI0030F570F2
MNSIGNRIKKLRTGKKITQKRFGEIFDLAESTIGMYERDERKPDYDTLCRIADYFEVSSDYLLGRKSTPTISPEEKDEAEFQAFKDDPSLEKWYMELPKSEEEDLQKLRTIWEMIKKDVNNK